MDLGEFWLSVTEPQAMLIVGVMTILAAVLGVSLGSWLFGGRVRDLQSAISTVEHIVEGHAAEVDKTLEKIRTDLEGLQVVLSETRGDISELESKPASPSEKEELTIAAPASDDQPTHAQLRSVWEEVRDELDRRAADPAIDGRTRAKYRRIDRRSLQSLIDFMLWDNTISEIDGRKFSDAWQIWNRYRNGKRQVDERDFEALTSIRSHVQSGRSGSERET